MRFIKRLVFKVVRVFLIVFLAIFFASAIKGALTDVLNGDKDKKVDVSEKVIENVDDTKTKDTSKPKETKKTSTKTTDKPKSTTKPSKTEKVTKTSSPTKAGTKTAAPTAKAGTASSKPTVKPSEATSKPTAKPAGTSAPANTVEPVSNGELRIHFIYCGNGDAVLLESNGVSMLIDGGDVSGKVTSYLKKNLDGTLNFVILTHPHKDHLTDLPNVIRDYTDANTKIYAPKVSTNTKIFESFLNAVEEKGLKLTQAKVGTKISLGSATITLCGPSGND